MKLYDPHPFVGVLLCILIGAILWGFLIWQAVREQEMQDAAREKYRQAQQLYRVNSTQP